MRGGTWIVGLAVVLAGNFVSLAAQERPAQDLRRPYDPLWQTMVGDSKGDFESASAANPEALLRNAFRDIEVRDTLVYCLQGLWCGDSCVSLMILNISDPANPKFVSRLRFHGGADTGYDLKRKGDYVYLTMVCSDYSSLFYVIDVSNPNTPGIVGTYPFQSYAFGIDVVDSLAFVVNSFGSSGDNASGIYILNVADPSDITPLDTVPTDPANGLYRIRVRGAYAYAVGADDLYIVDVTTPDSAKAIARMTTGYESVELDLKQDDSLIFVADADRMWPDYWSAFTVLNVADPVHPSILSRFPLVGSVIDVRVQDHWAFVSHGSCGLQVFDILNPATPDSVARYEIPRFAGRLAIQDTILLLPDIGPFVVDAEGLSCYPPIIGDNDPQEGDLLILNIADPTNPKLLGFYTPTDQDPTHVQEVEPELLPSTFSLQQNYPNPFNPETTIRYSLPVKARVSIDIYNLLGQSVIKLVDEEQPAGEHLAHWDGVDVSGTAVASGVYFYRITAGDEVISKKMMLLK